MEDKNVKDIIIEDAETSKGGQLKNILILLALLFIILVVSIVITRLILGGDDGSDTAHLRANGTVQETTLENNLTGTVSNGLASATSGAGQVATAGAAALAGAAATVALTSKNSDNQSSSEVPATASSTVKAPLLADRNTTAKTKVPLRTEEPKKSPSTATTGSTKKATTHHRTSHRTPKHSTYTAPKYVKKKTTTVKTTTKKVTTHRRSSHSSKRVTRGYYIKVGTFDNPSTAIRSIKAIKLNYRTTKTKKGLTRVLIGPFYSQRDAQNHLSKAKANVAADAYIAKIK